MTRALLWIAALAGWALAGVCAHGLADERERADIATRNLHQCVVVTGARLDAIEGRAWLLWTRHAPLYERVPPHEMRPMVAEDGPGE